MRYITSIPPPSLPPSLKLYQERVRRLEQEMGDKEEEVEGLRTELFSTQRMHHIAQEEVLPVPLFCQSQC